MAEVTTKIWGTTERVAIEDGMHMHRIAFEAGGVCSEHLHNYRHNLFYVLSGMLLIRIWWEPNRITERILVAGEALSVPCGVKHQFEGIQSGVALEVYWLDSSDGEVDEHDIVRFTQGYLR